MTNPLHDIWAALEKLDHEVDTARVLAQLIDEVNQKGDNAFGDQLIVLNDYQRVRLNCADASIRQIFAILKGARAASEENATAKGVAKVPRRQPRKAAVRR